MQPGSSHAAQVAAWATCGCSLGHLRLQALLGAGVSVWEADGMGGTAVHAAARSGHEECFRLLWQLPTPHGPPTEVHLLRDLRGKRALDHVFERGHARLARVARGDASDAEMALVEVRARVRVRVRVRVRIRARARASDAEMAVVEEEEPG